MRWGRNKRRSAEILPDEIFADSSNIPEFNTDQFEGRIERPLRRQTLVFLGVFFSILFGAYLIQAGNLQIRKGTAYAEQAENNQLERTILFADRGEIFDRTGRPLATNIRADENDF